MQYLPERNLRALVRQIGIGQTSAPDSYYISSIVSQSKIVCHLSLPPRHHVLLQVPHEHYSIEGEWYYITSATPTTAYDLVEHSPNSWLNVTL
jgi:hypothetical protein